MNGRVEETTYRDFQPRLTPRNIHHGRKQAHRSRNPRLEILARKPMRPQPPNHLERNIRAHRVPHKNNSYIPGALVPRLLHQLRDVVFRVPDVVLQAVGRVLAPLHGFDLCGLHLEARERAPVDLEFDIAV